MAAKTGLMADRRDDYEITEHAAFETRRRNIEEPAEVVTVYLTSRVAKYWRAEP